MTPADDVWPETLRYLSQQMTRSTFEAWLATSRLLESRSSASGQLYTVEVASALAVDWLENRLKETICRALAAVTGQPAQVEFAARQPTPGPRPDELPEPAEAGQPEVEFSGAYLDARYAIIQPDKVEVHSRYFRLKWRPLLGPLLSELVRELRQRCHYKSGRNTTRTTYKDLAAALGVSERTILRALERDEAGNFKNSYLGYFIKEVEVLRESDGQTIRSLGTKFTIYLDEPLTPEDEASLA